MKTRGLIFAGWLVTFWFAPMCYAQGPWIKLVETLATRAESVEARETGEKVALHNTDVAAEILAANPVKAPNPTAWVTRFDRLKGADDVLGGQWRALMPKEQRLALELGEGAQRVLAGHPGESGVLLLQNLDADGLALTRTYGDYVTDGMEWIESPETLEALGKNAPQAAAEWKSVVRKTGMGGGEFWRSYVAPHKVKWLAGGLLAVYLAAPEKFHDQLGRLTSYGAREIGNLLGDATLGTGNNLLAGIGESVRNHFAAAPISTVLTLAVIVGLLFAALPVGQTLLLRFFLRVLRRTLSSRPAAVRRHAPQRE